MEESTKLLIQMESSRQLDEAMFVLVVVVVVAVQIQAQKLYHQSKITVYGADARSVARTISVLNSVIEDTGFTDNRAAF